MNEWNLTLRAEPVPWFGLFFSWISMLLGIQLPSLSKTTIVLIPGDLVTVSAVAKGEADMGITTPPACTTMAFRGVGPFSEKMENLRAIASFPHDDRMIWAVSADLGINSIEELKDKKLRFAIPGKVGPVGFAVEKILEAYGMSIEELESRGCELIREDYIFKLVPLVTQGKADLVVHEGRKTPPWAQLTQSRRMKFLPVREDVVNMMVKEYGFRKGMLSKGMLDGAVEENIPTLDCSDWLLFTRGDTPDNVVYQVTRIVVENRHLFEMSFKGLPIEKSDLVYPIDPTKIWRNVGIPLHPAAERYYREHNHIMS